KIPPRVSLKVEPLLSMQEGEEQRIVCEAKGYYPLDVEIRWYKQKAVLSNQRVVTPLPKQLSHSMLSGQKVNRDGTYSVSAFFYLQASLGDSGKQFTCSVFHQSLSEPIKESFILRNRCV
uniref:Ig-like domain-containing protein n=1 Tax=Stegastes partitus TaxID=144197 RepID=A0A3B5B0B9_9TELE